VSGSDVAENWQPRKRCWTQSSREITYGFIQLDAPTSLVLGDLAQTILQWSTRKPKLTFLWL